MNEVGWSAVVGLLAVSDSLGLWCEDGLSLETERNRRRECSESVSVSGVEDGGVGMARCCYALYVRTYHSPRPGSNLKEARLTATMGCAFRDADCGLPHPSLPLNRTVRKSPWAKDYAACLYTCSDHAPSPDHPPCNTPDVRKHCLGGERTSAPPQPPPHPPPSPTSALTSAISPGSLAKETLIAASLILSRLN